MGQKAFIPREYDVFAGLDVDKRSISVTFSNQREEFMRSLHMPNNVEHLLKHVRKHFPDQKVAFAYEAGPTGTDCRMGFGPRVITVWWRHRR